ncbi:MAG: hypothetical protein LBQ46_09240 [Treponema sp.]|nr:hypothetical protein [Treponema sp.]
MKKLLNKSLPCRSLAPGFLALAGFLGCFLAPAGALSLEELADPDTALELREGEILSRVQLKNPAPVLAPRHGDVRAVLERLQGELGGGVMAESLARWEKPASASRGTWSEAERTALYNKALALSSLEGIQYYSASRGAMRTFYEESHVIDGPNTKREIPDPSFSSPPPSFTLYTRQKDLTFGNNLYQYQYLAGQDSLIFIQENLTTLTVGIIPAVGKHKLRSLVAVIDAGDCLLIYAASLAKASSFPGLGERIGNSFTNRALAILDWFDSQAKGAFEESRRFP